MIAEGDPPALTRALELYRGDLLAGFDLARVDDCNSLLVERGRLRDMAIQAGRRSHETAAPRRSLSGPGA